MLHFLIRMNPPAASNANGFNFETGLGPTTDRILNDLFGKLTNDQFREKLTDKIVGPVTGIIGSKVRPYVYVIAGLYIIVIVLLLVIIYLIVTKK